MSASALANVSFGGEHGGGDLGGRRSALQYMQRQQQHGRVPEGLHCPTRNLQEKCEVRHLSGRAPFRTTSVTAATSGARTTGDTSTAPSGEGALRLAPGSGKH